MSWVAAIPAIAQVGLGGIQGMQSKRAGQDAARGMDDRMGAWTDLLDNVMPHAMDALGGMGGILDQTMGHFGTGIDLMNRAGVAGQEFSGQMGGLADMLLGMAQDFPHDVGQEMTRSAVHDIGRYSDRLGAFQSGLGDYESALRGFAPPGYDFGGARSFLDETMSNFEDQAGRTRAMAQEQAARSMTAGGAGLDAALAGRGISGDSGLAVAGLSELMGEQSGMMANLNRELATQGQQMGLAAAQMDTQNRLTLDQMASNFALGSGGQALQALLGLDSAELQALMGAEANNLQALLGAGNLANLAGHLGLGASQMGIAGQDAAVRAALGAGDMMTRGFESPLHMQQDMFSRNVLDPMMGIGAAMTNLIPFLGQMFGEQTDMWREAAEAAGSGKGAGFGGAAENLQGALMPFGSTVKGSGGGGTSGGR